MMRERGRDGKRQRKGQEGDSIRDSRQTEGYRGKNREQINSLFSLFKYFIERKKSMTLDVIKRNTRGTYALMKHK
jgi:hypothetical protein